MTSQSFVAQEVSLTRRSSRRPLLWVLLALGLALLVTFPYVSPNTYYIHILTIGMLYAVLAASWDFLAGGAGQISFGHAGFFGVGAYAAAILAGTADINPWLAMPLGALIAAAFGMIVAMPALRLKGVYLALTTLAFAELARIVAVNWQSVTRGTLGYSLHPPLPGLGYDILPYFYSVLAFMLISVGFLFWLSKYTATGLVLRAIRADDIRAKGFGANIFGYKVLAFAVSAFFAGAAGAFYANYVHMITPSELDPKIAVLIIAMAVIGGQGTIVGPALAAIIIFGMTELLAIAGPVYKFTAVGVLLALFVLFLPKGVAGLVRRRRTNTD